MKKHLILSLSILALLGIILCCDKKPMVMQAEQKFNYNNYSIGVEAHPLEDTLQEETKFAVKETVQKEDDANEPLYQTESSYYLTETELVSNVPNNEEKCRSWNFTLMDYRCVTSTRSRQYKLLNSDHAYTDEVTGLRMYDDLYCVAVGSYYATVGQKIDVLLENGTLLHCIVGDAKADIHTDVTNRYQAYDGSVVEFIVDKRVFKGTYMYPEEIHGKVLNIELVDETIPSFE